MSDLFSFLLIFIIIETILSTFFFTVSKFYKNIVNWALTDIESSVAGTTTLDRECMSHLSCNNVAPVTNLCLGRATTRSHSSQWSKKKFAVET